MLADIIKAIVSAIQPVKNKGKEAYQRFGISIPLIKKKL